MTATMNNAMETKIPHPSTARKFNLQEKMNLGSNTDMTVKWLCMNLHFFCSLVSAMNIILGHYNLINLLELIMWMATLRV